MFQEIAFVLRNHGGDVAHRVSVQPLKVTSGEATFETIEMIPPGKEGRAVPTIDRFGNLQKHDIISLMMQEWNAAGELTGEFSRPMLILYEDFSKRKFQTKFDLVLFPVKQVMNQNRYFIRPGSEENVLEARSLELTMPRFVEGSNLLCGSS
ncbi:MAG TPA: hypothetical protein VG204_15440 [Terriglobia bacterium]|nr:hypothetical protein [Terriglobia bacterium]